MCDFVALTETKAVLQAILRYFKETNEASQLIESFIIDKDFSEWSAIKSLFPSSWVFLCQFHAGEAVRRALAGPRYGLSPTIRDAIEARFKVVMHTRSQSKYETLQDEFDEYVRAIDERVADYFVKNWFNIHLAWTNVGRAKFFSCGNTTTNRVESNWTQVSNSH